MRRYETYYTYVFRNEKSGEYRKYYGKLYSATIAKSKMGINSTETYDWKLISSSHHHKTLYR